MIRPDRIGDDLARKTVAFQPGHRARYLHPDCLCESRLGKQVGNPRRTVQYPAVSAFGSVQRGRRPQSRHRSCFRCIAWCLRATGSSADDKPPSTCVTSPETLPSMASLADMTATSPTSLIVTNVCSGARSRAASINSSKCAMPDPARV